MIRACGSKQPLRSSAYLKRVGLAEPLPDADETKTADPSRIAEELAFDAQADGAL
jgi:hypothetical protein